MYKFLVAAVKNYHKFGGLKQQKCIFSQFSNHLRWVKCASCDGPHGRSAAERSYPTPEARGGGEEIPLIRGTVAARAQEGLEELLHFQCQEGRLVQGKKQWLHFAGADVKRYPTSKVRETQIRQ